MIKLSPAQRQLFDRALAAFQAGRVADAEQLCQQVLRARADFFDALHLLAVIQSTLGKADAASVSFARALTMRPNDAEVHYNRGVALHGLMRYDEALASYDRVVALRPDYAEALNNRGNILKELGRFAEALTSYDRALAVQPNYVDALNNRGATLLELRQHEEALSSFDRALSLRPHDPEAMYNRGLVLKELRRLDEALASFDRALTLQPHYPEALNTRGSVLRELRRFEDALSSFERALALRPDYADAHWNEGLVRLQLGDFSNGWAKYEWGLKNGNRGRERHFAERRWTGAESLEGKTILLFSEQGFGDTIQFCRYVPLVAARGARVILEVHRPLSELMRSLAGVTLIVSEGDPRPEVDFQLSLLSLPAVLGTTFDTPLPGAPYLGAAPPTVDKWNARLGPKHRARIGLSWAGNPNFVGDVQRSIGLPPLLPLFARRDVEFFSIQKVLRPGDGELMNSHGIVHLGNDIQSFDDTAGIISVLDLLISSDTSVVHLAGALGRPVWVLLQYVPDWRWLIDRADTPWYPTARLFWQDATRTWDPVIMHVNEAIDDVVARGDFSPSVTAANRQV